MAYKYEQRIVFLLNKIAICCGDRQCDKRACSICTSYIAKCSRLVKRGQIPLLYYVELVRLAIIESREIGRN